MNDTRFWRVSPRVRADPGANSPLSEEVGRKGRKGAPGSPTSTLRSTRRTEPAVRSIFKHVYICHRERHLGTRRPSGTRRTPSGGAGSRGCAGRGSRFGCSVGTLGGGSTKSRRPVPGGTSQGGARVPGPRKASMLPCPHASISVYASLKSKFTMQGSMDDSAIPRGGSRATI